MEESCFKQVLLGGFTNEVDGDEYSVFDCKRDWKALYMNDHLKVVDLKKYSDEN